MSKAVEQFFQSLASEPKSAFYLLCNLITQNRHSRHNETNNDIDAIALRIKASQLSTLVDVFNVVQEKDMTLLDKSRVLSLNFFAKEVLRNKRFLIHMSIENIIKLSRDEKLVLDSLIACTQNFVHQQKSTNPFAAFNFRMLDQADIEQLLGSLSNFVAQCHQLPLVQFKSIGEININSARTVLHFVEQHPSRFELAQYFLEVYPELQKEIYQDWIQTKQSKVLTVEEQDSLTMCAKSVAEKYPAFKDIKEAARLKQTAPQLITIHQDGQVFRLACGFTSMVSAYASLASLLALGASCTGPACLATSAINPIVGLGAFAVLESYMALTSSSPGEQPMESCKPHP